MLELLEYRRLERGFFTLAPCTAAGLDSVALDGRQHARRLFATHHIYSRIRPHPQETWRVRTAAHPVVAGTEAAADDHGEFWNLSARHSGHHLGTMARDAFVFVFAADHEAADVLQEHERYLALAAKFDKVRRFLRAFGKQDAVVRNDSDRHAFDPGKSGHQRRCVASLPFVELRSIDDARNDLAH